MEVCHDALAGGKHMMMMMMMMMIMMMYDEVYWCNYVHVYSHDD